VDDSEPCQIASFREGEVIGFQVLLDSIHPHGRRASWWPPPVLHIGSLKVAVDILQCRWIRCGVTVMKSFYHHHPQLCQRRNNGRCVVVVGRYCCGKLPARSNECRWSSEATLHSLSLTVPILTLPSLAPWPASSAAAVRSVVSFLCPV